MPDKTTTALETPLRQQLDRLAAFQSTDFPVLSLYLDMQPNEHGRPRHNSFLRKTLSERSRTITASGGARESFERDVHRIQHYLDEARRPSSHGLAIFACHGAGLFEAFQLDVPLNDHWLFIGAVPHLYPLARVNDQYPRYAALLVDTNSARLFVFSLGAAISRQEIRNVKTRKGAVGGWAQARYQRHVENYHRQHMREVVDLLDRVVREEAINQIVVSCDEVAKPLLFAELPPHLSAKVVDLVRMDINTPEHEVLRETLDGLRAKDLQTDEEHVEELIGAWQAGGLAVVGPESTLEALQMGQVEELLIAATPDALRPTATLPPDAAPGPVEIDTTAAGGGDPNRVKLADELVTRAHQSGARIRFIEKADRLTHVGGCGALLRFAI